MSASPAFRLQTLGTLRLFAPDGREAPLLVNRRQKLALLALLAITRRPISRDRLVDLFWGDRSEARGRHSLSEALSQLRRVVGPHAIRARQSEIALAEYAPVVVDLRALAEAAASRHWARVIELYDGPFFDGIHVDGSPEWEHWVFAQRQGAERLFEGACRAQTEQLESAAHWGELEAVSGRWLLHSPLDPLAACRHLTSIARGAPASAAARLRVHSAYDRLAQRLATDHGVVPAEAVTACRDRLVAVHMASLEGEPAVSHGEPSTVLNPPETIDVPATPTPAAMGAGPRPSPARPVARSRFGTRLAVAAAAFGVLALVTGLRFMRDSVRLPSRQTLSPAAVEARRLEAMAMRGGFPAVTRAETIALLEQAVSLDSTLAMAHRNLALLWEGDGTRSTLVSASLTRAAALTDQVTPAEREAILSSYHLLVSGDYAQAAEHQRKLLQLNPQDGDAWHDLGMTYQYLGDHARAAEAYRQTLARERTSAPTWSNLVDALYALGDLGAAESAIDSMASAIPGHPSIFSATARVKAASGDLRTAEAQARAYLAATSSRPRSQGIGEMLLSRILWTQGRVDEGDAAVRRGIESQLRAADSVMALREAIVLAVGAYWIRSDATLAKQRLREALRRIPIENLPAADRPYLELATAQSLAGETEAATQSLEAYDRLVSAAARRRNIGTEALARGTLALQSGRLRSAVTLLHDAATVDCPACGLPELGVVYAMLGKPDSATLVQERYLAYQSLRRTDLQDALHRRRLEAHLRRLTD